MRCFVTYHFACLFKHRNTLDLDLDLDLSYGSVDERGVKVGEDLLVLRVSMTYEEV